MGEVASFTLSVVRGNGEDSPQTARLGYDAAARLTARDVVVGPRWLVGAVPDWRVAIAAESWLWLAAPLAVLGVVAFLGQRTRRLDIVVGQVLAATALLSTLAGFAAIRGYAFDWLTRSSWSVGAFLGLMIMWGAVDAIPRTIVRTGATVLALVGSGALVVATAIASVSPEPRYEAFTAPMHQLIGASSAWLDEAHAARVMVIDRGSSTPTTLGLVDGLDRLGFTVVTTPEFSDALLPGHVPVGGPTDATLMVVSGSDPIDRLVSEDRLQLVTTYEPTPAQRERGVQPVAVFAGT